MSALLRILACHSGESLQWEDCAAKNCPFKASMSCSRDRLRIAEQLGKHEDVWRAFNVIFPLGVNRSSPAQPLTLALWRRAAQRF
ncbi:hypothetical protein WJX75_000702 [Coccomyxa subellipsoidea]|uniref:Uncharacterized protein n=1 Tax=Coccomyxa subellipsoidea TaxID=248742 RepID=A0ABR2YDG4_9CHLO